MRLSALSVVFAAPLAAHAFAPIRAATARAPIACAASSADWRAKCDSDGVVSYHDFGVRLGGAAAEADAKAAALEARMESWEATDEERAAATLGGLVPGSSGMDGFDMGLWLAAPPLFLSLALFLFFPLVAPQLAGDLPPPQA